MNARVERARSLLGAPYLHLGRDANGIDCVGLLMHVDQVDASQVPAYPPDPLNNELENALTSYYGQPLLVGVPTLDQLCPGDIVAMQYRGPTRHVGIVGVYQFPGCTFSLVHTDSMHGKVVEHRLDAKWLRRITRVYRT